MSTQNGVISKRQALECGATDGFIRVRLDSGEWEGLSAGVYANTSAPRTWERALRAALLSHPVAYVAGLSAAHLHGFPGVGRTRPEVLIPYGGNNRSKISRVIRARHFDKVAHDDVSGFRCTNVAETILTLSLRIPSPTIERYVDDRLAARSLRIEDFHPILERLEFARQPGLRPLRRIVSARADDTYQPPATELERLLYRLLDHPELPPYARQVPIAYPSSTATVDAYIANWRLVVEADGRRWHTREQDFHRDRQRDNDALAAGLIVTRFTWNMLKYRPEDCLQTLLDIGRTRA